MLRNKYTLEYAFDLQEVCKKAAGITSDLKLDQIPAFTTVFGYLFNTADTTYWTTKEGKKLWELIFLYHFEDIIAVSEDGNIDNYQSICRNFGTRFYSIWSDTHEYYEKLLALYDSQKNNLLNKLETISTTKQRYNDTPQNESEGVYDDDDHATNTNYNNTKLESDPATIITRLDEIKNKLIKYYSEWASKFNSLFISNLNYEGE